MKLDQSLLEVSAVTKRFPGVVANDDVSFSVHKGEIHALLGENGAGKSTLVKMIYGVLKPDQGEIHFDGKTVAITNPREARSRGIGMVFQHFSLFQALTVMDNIALGMADSLSTSELEREVQSIMKAYNVELDPKRLVSSLSVGEQQRIEIVRALLLKPKLLIMDEPTSVLTPQEVEQLFLVLQQLASEGCAILYISHKLKEVQTLCSSATLLRGGRVVGTCNPKEKTSAELAEMMVGSKISPLSREILSDQERVVLSVQGLSLPKIGAFDVHVKSVSFEAVSGRILGIAGVAGNGQNELLSALSGERLSQKADTVVLNGKPLGKLRPSERRRAGLCCVPEERNGHAAVGSFSLAENTLITARERQNLTQQGIVSARKASDYADRVITEFSVKAQGNSARADSLSGGNLQKFIMGRELIQAPDCLVVSQPTWGVDPGAAMMIRQRLIDCAKAGGAVVVISQDLDELLGLADQLAVMSNGELSEAKDTHDMTVEMIGLLMGGIHEKDDTLLNGEERLAKEGSHHA